MLEILLCVAASILEYRVMQLMLRNICVEGVVWGLDRAEAEEAGHGHMTILFPAVFC